MWTRGNGSTRRRTWFSGWLGGQLHGIFTRKSKTAFDLRRQRMLRERSKDNSTPAFKRLLLVMALGCVTSRQRIWFLVLMKVWHSVKLKAQHWAQLSTRVVDNSRSCHNMTRTIRPSCGLIATDLLNGALGSVEGSDDNRMKWRLMVVVSSLARVKRHSISLDKGCFRSARRTIVRQQSKDCYL
jgi:hypothetical protein